MREYTPDRWVIVKIQKNKDSEAYYRVFAGWYGGYTQGDSWKMSSGIEKSIDKGDYYEIHNASGSIYKCFKGTLEDGTRGGDLGMSGYMSMVYLDYKKQAEETGMIFETVDFIPLLEKPAA